MILPLSELILDEDAQRKSSDLNFDDRPQIDRDLTNGNQDILVEAYRHSENDVFVCGQTE